MITGTGVGRGGSAIQGIKKDIEAKKAITKREQKRRDIDDINEFIKRIDEMGILDKIR